MNVKVVKGIQNYINDCEDALVNSELGNRYFSKKGSARKSLEEGFDKGEVYVALDENNCCKGFVWVIENGIFHAFPYIHIIAVKSEYRGQGIGRILLEAMEQIYFEKYTKLFLVVGDFNQDAKRLYERIGYSSVGYIPDLYRSGITECLMMKVAD
ncbi:GNAT family N-acetyltransferase [Anaeromicropila herbilytica]|uniref:N-acetyltransferase domain-containing protein n=1 Tax=Anaeromicropila herbilytica TaxID=2785025 RepID=A0A7R7IE64_9FIRM|nr:N-acetyltransferase [Anaeromicropila herbilytica]BCN32302.1 hypothetical protein bsdtb5_35970 [Anaeromicropila herbilytica]